MIRTERLAIGGSIAVVSGLACWQLARTDAQLLSLHHLAGGMHAHAADPAALPVGIAMWSTMVVAMMLPSATPMLLGYASIGRASLPSRLLALRVGLFAAGYLAVWLGFAILAATLQWQLHIRAPHLGEQWGGPALVVAGLWQWSPWKHACLRHCRTPMTFFLTSWRPGSLGAWRMGVRHGAFCVGCCWAVMAMMGVLGLMNLVWLAVFGGLALAERIIPAGGRLAVATGAVFCVWGIGLIILGR